ncbi:MAG: HDOD domain-containing protein [Azoarcus sp.]|jgi:HD-like signal output (HDOD) protein|nr:HDOD domain-containing protein [Azoarcus sp.]
MEESDSKVLSGVTIPAHPAVLTQVMEELKSSAINGKKIAQLISQDAGISAIVTRVANSPVFGNGSRVSSIMEAVETLGFGSLADLVQKALLQNTTINSNIPFDRFWDNSRYTGLAAKRLADIVGQIDPDTAYTFGLFHDCGIPLLAQRYPEYKNVLSKANKDSKRIFTSIEEEAIGTSHAIIGYYLARAWGLSDAITQGILQHHDYAQLESPQNTNSEAHRLIAINVMAEFAANTHLRTVQDTEWAKAREAVSIFLGYSVSNLDDIIDDLIYQFDKTLAHHKENE